MLLDKQNLFSEDQAVTATAASTNFINLGTPATVPGAPAPLTRDIGGAQNIPIAIKVTEDFATLTSLTVEIQVDDNTAFSSPKTVGSTGPVAAAELVAGKLMPLGCVPFGADQQYMRLNYTVTGTNATAGTITAGITTGAQTNGR